MAGTTANTFSSAIQAAAAAISTAAKVSVKVVSFGAQAGTTIAKGAQMAAQAAAAAAAAAKNANRGGAPQQAARGNTGGSTGGGAKQSNILLKWHDVAFYASASEVRGFRDLTISSSCETEDEEDGGEKYVKLKNKKGFEISLKAFFDKRLGIANVKSEAMKIANYATIGQSGYFYAQNAKLVSTSMMLTSAKVQNVLMTPTGNWFSAEVQMTLKSCSKLGDMGAGASGGGSSGGGGGGGKKPDTETQTSYWQKSTEMVNKAMNKSTEVLNKLGTALKQLSAAKKTSSKNETKTGVTNRANQVKNAKTKPVVIVDNSKGR